MKKNETQPAVKKKPRVSPAGCRAKGNSAENEVIKILDSAGVPSQKVLGSGKFKASESVGDIKVGIPLNKDGTKPPADETPSVLRMECKAHNSTSAKMFACMEDAPEFKVEAVLALMNGNGPEATFKHLDQDAITKAVVLRRPKVPSGAIKNEDWGKVYVVAMPIDDWIEMFKKAHGFE